MHVHRALWRLWVPAEGCCVYWVWFWPQRAELMAVWAWNKYGTREGNAACFSVGGQRANKAWQLHCHCLSCSEDRWDLFAPQLLPSLFHGLQESLSRFYFSPFSRERGKPKVSGQLVQPFLNLSCSALHDCKKQLPCLLPQGPRSSGREKGKVSAGLPLPDNTKALECFEMHN